VVVAWEHFRRVKKMDPEYDYDFEDDNNDDFDDSSDDFD
jgi:hypothetical protein